MFDWHAENGYGDPTRSNYGAGWRPTPHPTPTCTEIARWFLFLLPAGRIASAPSGFYLFPAIRTGVSLYAARNALRSSTPTSAIHHDETLGLSRMTSSTGIAGTSATTVISHAAGNPARPAFRSARHSYGAQQTLVKATRHKSGAFHHAYEGGGIFRPDFAQIDLILSAKVFLSEKNGPASSTKLVPISKDAIGVPGNRQARCFLFCVIYGVVVQQR